MLLYLLFFIVLIIFIYFFRNSIIINIYKLPMIRKSWQLPHMNAHNVNLVNNDKPVVVCCGDSITHGHIGYDWVSTLRKNDDSKVYINAGINADLTWNLNQRIEDIIKHDPEYITILIGTNDAIGSQPVKSIQDYYMETKGLPQKPSIDWYKEQLEFFIKNIKEYTNAKIAIFTLPWLGEQKTSSIMQVVRSHNKIIKDFKMTIPAPTRHFLCKSVRSDWVFLSYHFTLQEGLGSVRVFSFSGPVAVHSGFASQQLSAYSVPASV